MASLKASPPRSPQSLGEFLRSLRTVRKLTLRDVEEAAGISNAYLSQIENDKIGKPSPHILHKLADVYGVVYEMLMERAGYITRSTGSGDAPSGRLATFATQELTPEEEEELLKYLAFLRSSRRGNK